ncbi:ABC transporter ATP-binding protein [Gorillibacterium sp. sgz5001074]|uniref:ABC transporter ATP-binding protein n=1 Tax=Gorillibacterium sp. sgz5001074 TaxID=3446695 RepID=UPI003F668ACD
MSTLVRVSGLAKTYGRRTVLQPVSFELEQGECLVLSGPNGSGKSTLLRLLAGLTKPDQGTITLEWEGPYALRRIGYVPDRMPLLRFTPTEYLRHMGAIRGMEKGRRERRIKELLAFCRLETAEGQPIRQFSKGMLQKVGLMQALLDEPQLLLLDEPFSGLDAGSQADLLGLLQELKDQGLALVLVSHEPELAGRLADRLLVFAPGGVCRELQPDGKEERMVVQAAGLTDTVVKELVLGYAGLQAVRHGETVRFSVPSGRSDELLLAMLQAGGKVRSVRSAGSGERET